MEIKSFKSVSKFWQEITFAVSIGIVLIALAREVMLGYKMDRLDICLVSFFLPLLLCLIGQIVWRKWVLAVILSILLGLCSIGLIFMSGYFLGTTSTQLIQATALMIISLFLFIAAITMPVKY